MDIAVDNARGVAVHAPCLMLLPPPPNCATPVNVGPPHDGLEKNAIEFSAPHNGAVYPNPPFATEHLPGEALKMGEDSVRRVHAASSKNETSNPVEKARAEKRST